uniref:Uncharacterized protein n=1 Tax=uncultured prokaryote TaxID=198431 RepID=A0A0H5Q3V4_9ZZZZ|nr:hypothetical protein [uncultured prokaryote]
MNVTLSVYRSGDVHKLTVVARPSTSAILGEHLLIEGQVMSDLPLDCSAAEALSEAYRMVAVALVPRSAVRPVES